MLDAQALEPLFSWTHAEVIGIIVVPIVLAWWDNRKQNRKMHEETQDANWQMHNENQLRLKEIETKLDPVWDWWTRMRNGGHL